ncbi:hypothetical protein ERO13_A05G312533v2 [Gossypium hirsutum]|uniref:Secreted protein n=1 Tax=Gossypium barbadense TaxID=3634 RepID=A0A5J5NFF3_GOSBA|nr:hypothetical protein [Gossypium barbadense]KAG4202043.1 hypothetical protein ERO13_A05G312533v2 [Gossypium hirsutum]
MCAPITDLSLFLLLTRLIMARESPSISTYFNPRFFPISSPCRHARASAANPEGTFSFIVVVEFMTSPLQSLMMIPEHDL